MNKNKYLFIIFLSYLFFSGIHLQAQDHNINDASAVKLKVKKGAIVKILDTHINLKIFENSFILLSVVEEQKNKYQIVISSPPRNFRLAFFVAMADAYRFQPFIGISNYKGYEMYIYGNAADDFFKQIGKTTIPANLIWTKSLKNKKLYLKQPNEPSMNEKGETLPHIHIDIGVFQFLYYKHKIIFKSFHTPLSYDDLTIEENIIFNKMAPKDENLTLKQFKEKYVKRQ